ncbi:MAG TPA: PIN domain-containing protein [Candidatus Humimicrobiaceae bacterium]|nr:PIN domain-containing protein [Candidatus Humimicrobiaceae bacterium]
MDTSAVIGLMDKNYKKHEYLKTIFTKKDNLYILPSTAIGEISYMLNSRFGNKVELIFLEEIVRTNFQLELLKDMDIIRIIEILKKYDTLNIGYVDASIVAIAERLKINKILTLDRKHFEIVIPRGFDRFDILI